MSDERQQQWTTIKTAWIRGEHASLNTDLFDNLFYSGAIATEAIELMKTSPIARMMITRAASQAGAASLQDSDRRRVWLAVQDDDDADDLFAAQRTPENAALRCNFVEAVVQGLLDVKGRQWVRQKARRWWASADLLEEEREAIVRTLIDKGITDLGFFRTLGTTAATLAEDALWRSGMRDFGLVSARLRIRRRTSASTVADLAVGRVESLLTPVILLTDIRDACFEEAEFSRLRTLGFGCAGNQSLFARAILRAGGRYPNAILHELTRELSRNVPSMRLTPTGPEGNYWGFPLLRLLHLQLILEAPSLSRSLETPELALVPELALYLIGRDAISYVPELRIHREVDRRWRARWVESAAEAVACAFLEDALELNLDTLVRIPEQSNRLTPDFMARTLRKERVVFESKGGTAWAFHLQQRKQAVRPLAKGGGVRGLGWAGGGRAFACSLFAAQQGDERSTLLHVDDPVFAFGDLFHEGWESACQRRHYSGVLESARLFDLADCVTRRERLRPRERTQGELHPFDLPEGDRIDERHRFVGSYLPLEEWIRSLRHPEPDALQGLRVFAGVEQGVYSRLAEGELPTRTTVESGEQTPGGDIPWSSVTGILSSREGEGAARGAYSLLSDGSFLAIEFE